MKTTLIVLGCLLALILLLLILRVGVQVEYSAEGVLVQARAGPLHITLIPKRKKRKKEKPPKKKKTQKRKKEKKAQTESEKQKKRGGSLKTLLDLLPILLEALGSLCRRIRIEYLRVHYTIAGQPDPSSAALMYGRLQLGSDAVCHLLERYMQVLERDVTVEVDFFTEEMTVYAAASCSLRVGQILAVALRLLWQYWNWNRQRKRAAQEG